MTEADLAAIREGLSAARRVLERAELLALWEGLSAEQRAGVERVIRGLSDYNRLRRAAP